MSNVRWFVCAILITLFRNIELSCTYETLFWHIKSLHNMNCMSNVKPRGALSIQKSTYGFMMHIIVSHVKV